MFKVERSESNTLELKTARSQKKKQKMKKNHIQVEMANLEYYIGMDFGLYVLLFQ